MDGYLVSGSKGQVRLSACNNMAVLCYNMEEYKKSLEYFEMALNIILKSLGPSHPHVTSMQQAIEVVKQKL